MNVKDLSLVFPSFKKNLERTRALKKETDYLKYKSINKSGVNDSLKTRSEYVLIKAEDIERRNLMNFSSLNNKNENDNKNIKNNKNEEEEFKTDNLYTYDTSATEEPEEELEELKDELPELIPRAGGSQKTKKIKETHEKILDSMPDFESDIAVNLSPEENYASEKFTRIIEGYAQRYSEVKDLYFNNIKNITESFSPEKRPDLFANYAGLVANYNFKQWIKEKGFSKTVAELGNIIDTLDNEGRFEPFDIIENMNMYNWLSSDEELKRILHSDDSYKSAYIKALKSIYDSIAPEYFNGFVKDEKNNILKRAAADLYDLKNEKVSKKLLISSIRAELEKDFKKEEVDKIMPQVKYYINKNYSSLNLEEYTSTLTQEEREKLVAKFSESKTLKKISNLQGRRGEDPNKIAIEDLDEKSLAIYINEFIAELKLNPQFSKYRKNAEATAAKIFGPNFNKYYNKDLVVAKMQSSPIYIKTLMSSVNTLINAYNGLDDRFGTKLRPKEERIRSYLNTENIDEISEADYKSLSRFYKYHFEKIDKYIKDELNDDQRQNINVKAYQILKKMYESEAISFIADKDDRAFIFLDTMLTESRGMTEYEKKNGKFFREGVAFISDPLTKRKKLYVKDIINSPMFLNPQLLQKLVSRAKERSKSEVYTGNFEKLVKEILPLVTGSYYRLPKGSTKTYSSPEEAAEDLYLNNPFIKRLQKAVSSPEEFKKFLLFIDGAATDLGTNEEGERYFDLGLLNDDLREFFKYDEIENYRPSSKHFDLDIKKPEQTELEKTVFKTSLQHEKFFEKIKQNPKLINELPQELKDNIEYALDVYDRFYGRFKDIAKKQHRGLNEEEELNLVRTELVEYFNFDLQLPKILFKDTEPFNFFRETDKIEDTQIKYMILEAKYILELLDEDFFNKLTSDEIVVDKKGIKTDNILAPVDWKEILAREKEQEKEEEPKKVEPRKSTRDTERAKKLIEEQIKQLESFSPTVFEPTENIFNKLDEFREKYPEIMEEYEETIDEAEEKRKKAYEEFKVKAVRAVEESAKEGKPIPQHIKNFIDEYDNYEEGFRERMTDLFQYVRLRELNIPSFDKDKFDILKEKQITNAKELLNFLNENPEEAKEELELTDEDIEEWKHTLRDGLSSSKKSPEKEEEIIEEDEEEEEPEEIPNKNVEKIEKILNKMLVSNEALLPSETNYLSELEDAGLNSIKLAAEKTLKDISENINPETEEGISTIKRIVSIMNKVEENPRHIRPIEKVINGQFSSRKEEFNKILKKKQKVNEPEKQPVKFDQINEELKKWREYKDISEFKSDLDKKISEYKESNPKDYEKNKDLIYNYLSKLFSVTIPVVEPIIERIKSGEATDEDFELADKLSSVDEEYKKLFEDLIEELNKEADELELEEDGVTEDNQKVLNVKEPEYEIEEELSEPEETEEEFPTKRRETSEIPESIRTDRSREAQLERAEAKRKDKLERELGEERPYKKTKKIPVKDKERLSKEERREMALERSKKNKKEKNEEEPDPLEVLDLSPELEDGRFIFKPGMNKSKELKEVIEQQTKPFENVHVYEELLEEIPFFDKTSRANIRRSREKAQTLKNLALNGLIVHTEQTPIIVKKEDIPKRYENVPEFDEIKMGQYVPWELSTLKDKQSALFNILFELSTEKDPTGLRRLRNIVKNDEEFKFFKEMVKEALPGVPVDSELEIQGADLNKFREENKDAIIPYDYYKKKGVTVDKIEVGEGGEDQYYYSPRKDFIDVTTPKYRSKNIYGGATKDYLDVSSLKIPKKPIGEHKFGKELIIDAIRKSKFRPYLDDDEKWNLSFTTKKLGESDEIVKFLEEVVNNLKVRNDKEKEELIDNWKLFKSAYDKWKTGSDKKIDKISADGSLEQPSAVDVYLNNLLKSLEKTMDYVYQNDEYLPQFSEKDEYYDIHEVYNKLTNSEQFPYLDSDKFRYSIRDIINDLRVNYLENSEVVNAIKKPTISIMIPRIVRMDAQKLEDKIDKGQIDIGKKSKEAFINEFKNKRTAELNAELYQIVIDNVMKEIAKEIQEFIVEKDLDKNSTLEIQDVFNGLYDALKVADKSEYNKKIKELEKLVPINFSKSGLSTIMRDANILKGEQNNNFVNAVKEGGLNSEDILEAIKAVYGDKYEEIDNLLYKNSKSRLTFETIITDFVNAVNSEDSPNKKEKIKEAYRKIAYADKILNNNREHNLGMRNIMEQLKAIKNTLVPTKPKRKSNRIEENSDFDEEDEEEL